MTSAQSLLFLPTFGSPSTKLSGPGEQASPNDRVLCVWLPSAREVAGPGADLEEQAWGWQGHLQAMLTPPSPTSWGWSRLLPQSHWPPCCRLREPVGPRLPPPPGSFSAHCPHPPQLALLLRLLGPSWLSTSVLPRPWHLEVHVLLPQPLVEGLILQSVVAVPQPLCLERVHSLQRSGGESRMRRGRSREKGPCPPPPPPIGPAVSPLSPPLQSWPRLRGLCGECCSSPPPGRTRARSRVALGAPSRLCLHYTLGLSFRSLDHAHGQAGHFRIGKSGLFKSLSGSYHLLDSYMSSAV